MLCLLWPVVHGPFGAKRTNFSCMRTGQWWEAGEERTVAQPSCNSLTSIALAPKYDLYQEKCEHMESDLLGVYFATP